MLIVIKSGDGKLIAIEKTLINNIYWVIDLLGGIDPIMR